MVTFALEICGNQTTDSHHGLQDPSRKEVALYYYGSKTCATYEFQYKINFFFIQTLTHHIKKGLAKNCDKNGNSKDPSRTLPKRARGNYCINAWQPRLAGSA